LKTSNSTCHSTNMIAGLPCGRDRVEGHIIFDWPLKIARGMGCEELTIWVIG
jgi:hypothetical protein